MEITFIGTRANIKRKTTLHTYNAAALIEYRSTTIMIDCGSDWRSSIKQLAGWPDGILLTHAHPDHVGGLTDGAPCPVYALKHIHELTQKYPLRMRKVIVPRKPFVIGDITIEALSVEHAINTPAVGYRITAGSRTIFYVSDLVRIQQPNSALRGIDLYIGDGSRVTHPLIRHHDGKQLGHTSIAEQLAWCRRTKVERALFTHCGTELITDEAEAKQKVVALGKELGITAGVACDEMTVRL